MRVQKKNSPILKLHRLGSDSFDLSIIILLDTETHAVTENGSSYLVNTFCPFLNAMFRYSGKSSRRGKQSIKLDPTMRIEHHVQ